MVCRRFIHAVLVLCLAILVSCSGSNILQRSSNARTLSYSEYGIQLEHIITESYAGMPDPLTINTTSISDQLIVNLVVAEDADLSELLFELTYDDSVISPTGVTFFDCLGGKGKAVTFSESKTPGCVTLGEVTIGLLNKHVKANDLYASVAFICEPFSPSRAPSDYLDPKRRELTWRLRRNMEFADYDVPFKVEQQDSLVEITWEEALSNDANNNGMVEVSDLVEVGRYFGHNMVILEDYIPWIPSDENHKFTHMNWELSSLHNIGRRGKDEPGTQEYFYGPVIRDDPKDDDVPGEAMKYIVTAAVLTDMAIHFNCSVAGYELELWDGNPSTGLIADDLSDVEAHPCTSQDDSLADKSMDEYSNFNLPSLTYMDFCSDVCDGYDERAAYVEVPRSGELLVKRLYKKIINLADYPGVSSIGDLHMGVRAIPMNDGYLANWYPPPTDENLMLTWHPTVLNPTAAVNEPTVAWAVPGQEGIHAIQRGDYTAWTETDDKMRFRISMGVAELAPGHPNPEDWEVKYAVFASTDLTSLWDSIDQFADVPETRYYPSDQTQISKATPQNPNPDGVVKMFDLDHPAGWVEFPTATGRWFDHTVYVGVKAYAVKKYFDDKYIYRSSFVGDETDYLSVDFTYTEPVVPDVTPPVFSGVKNWSHGYSKVNGGFRPMWALTSSEFSGFMPDGRWGTSSLGVFDGDRHMNSGVEDVWGVSFNLWLWGRIDPLYDLDNNNVNTGRETLQLRFEVYRTDHDWSEFKDYIDDEIAHPNGALNWLADPNVIHELYGIAMQYPKRATSPQGGFLAEMFGQPYGIREDADVFRAPFMPSISDDDPEAIEATGFEYAEYMDEWKYWTRNFVPGPGEVLPNCDFMGSGTLQFVYDEELESDLNGEAYNYVIFAAVNDSEKNCTYDNVIESESENDGRPSYLAFHAGEIPYNMHSEGIARDFVTVYDYEGGPLYRHDFNDYIQDIAHGRNYEHWNYENSANGQSSIDLRKCEYIDIATAPDGSLRGYSYYDNGSKKVRCFELDPVTSSFCDLEVDSAIRGDTSIVYDFFGNPHFLYYRGVNSTSDYPSGTEPGVSHVSSRLVSNAEVPGIYYRARINGEWTARELVSEGIEVAPLKHKLHYRMSAVDPLVYAIIPTMGGSPGINDTGLPAIAHRIGLNIWTVTTLATPCGLTNTYLDSCQVSADSDETYVAIYSPLGDSFSNPIPTLQLGHFDGTWTVEDVVVGDVDGHQSIALVSPGTVAISYKTQLNGSLAYCKVTNSSVVDSWVSEASNNGYQTAIGTMNDGRPVMMSINTDLWEVCMTVLDGESNLSQPLFGADCSDRNMGSNTLCITDYQGRYEIGWILPNLEIGTGRIGR